MKRFQKSFLLAFFTSFVIVLGGACTEGVPTGRRGEIKARIEVGEPLSLISPHIIPPEELRMEIYSDPCLGYSINYPPDYWPVEKGEGIALVGPSYISILIEAMPDFHQSLDKLVEQRKPKGVKGRISEGSLQFNSWEARRITWIDTEGPGEGGMVVDKVLTVANDIGYEICFNLPGAFYGELKPLIDAIIASFTIGQPKAPCKSTPPRSPPPTIWEDPGPDLRLFSIPAVANHVSASGMKVVWSGPGEGEGPFANSVYCYDLATGKKIKIAEATRPGGQTIPAHISGDWVVWVDYADILRGRDWIIFAYNLKTGERLTLASADDEAKEETLPPSPHIQGGKVVWSQLEPQEKRRQVIKVYDLSVKKVTTIASASYDLAAPSIYGNKIAYLGVHIVTDASTSGGEKAPSDVYLYDLEEDKVYRVSASGKASQPSLWGDKVIWLEDWVDEEGNWLGANVFLHDLMSGKTYQLTRGGEADLPSIGEALVTWSNAHLNWISAYSLSKEELEVIDRGFVGKVWTSGKTLAWIRGDPVDSVTKTEIRVIVYP